MTENKRNENSLAGSIIDPLTPLFERTVKAWGTWSQILMAVEEADEFALACLKFCRNPSEVIRRSSIIEEIADLEFMLDQVKWILQVKPHEVADIRIEKERRVEHLLAMKWREEY